jgi:hypothetical protein
MDVNDWHMDLGWLLPRSALTAPVILMIWLIRRDIRREGPAGRLPDQS